jgi:epoxyqueuosine reductase QueG
MLALLPRLLVVTVAAEEKEEEEEEEMGEVVEEEQEEGVECSSPYAKASCPGFTRRHTMLLTTWAGAWRYVMP